MRKGRLCLLALVATLLVAAPVTAQVKSLNGAGATFPAPVYTKWAYQYNQETGVKVNYQAIGSGGGIAQIKAKTVDFGGTDAFMSDEDLAELENDILHVPTCLGAGVVTYNVPDSPTLNLTPDVVADIFLGKLTKWNDERIARANPGVKLPDMTIVVVHRSDGSGTTFIFSDYLSKVSEVWKKSVGTGKSLNWPSGLGAKGNPGVAGLVKQLPGSVGYVELIYAVSNNMPVANIKNHSGKFVTPSIASVSLAAGMELPEHTRVSITDTNAEDGYPISGFTWIIFYKEQKYDGRRMDKARELMDLVWWVTHDGQELAEPLHYAPLPAEAVKKAEAVIKSTQYGGKPILK